MAVVSRTSSWFRGKAEDRKERGVECGTCNGSSCGCEPPRLDIVFADSLTDVSRHKLIRTTGGDAKLISGLQDWLRGYLAANRGDTSRLELTLQMVVIAVYPRVEFRPVTLVYDEHGQGRFAWLVVPRDGGKTHLAIDGKSLVGGGGWRIDLLDTPILDWPHLPDYARDNGGQA